MVSAKRQRQVWAVVTCSALLLSLDAEARVGGGQSFGGGGGSSGGDSDGLGLLLELLFRFLWWLCWNYPAIGIPTTIVVLVALYFFFMRGAKNNLKNKTNSASMMREKKSVSAVKLIDLDPKFSETLFLDYVQLVYTQFRQGLPSGQIDHLRAHIDEKVLKKEKGLPQPKQLQNVIFGSLRVDKIQVGNRWQTIHVSILTNFDRVTQNDIIDKRLRVERWTFRRRSGLSSFGPEQLRSLGCPACGSNLPVTENGRCPSCDVIRSEGRLHWLLTGISMVSDSKLNAIDLTLGGGIEPGVNLPTKIDGELGQGLRALQARHPNWSKADFRSRVTTVFTKLQSAWSTRKWETARPYQSDALFRVNQFWIRQYQQDNVWNKNDAIDIKNIEFSKVFSDSWLESITVRITASMLDWTEKEDGTVVAGSKTETRTFSEYWTFIRSIGAESKAASVNDCPSCGAPLDNVNMSGICEYCDTHITTGQFDWVLSRIEQAEAYSG